jgi:phosphohistidine swiveling domain-containing protein
MKIPFDKKWLIMEKEDYANYLFVSVTWESFTKMTKDFGFIPGKFYGAEYINSACNLFVLKEPYDEANKKHFEMLFANPKAWDRLHQLTKKYSDDLFSLGKRIQHLRPTKLTNQGLIKWIDAFQLAQAKVHVPRGPMFLLETPSNLVTNYLIDYLKEKAGDVQKNPISPFDAFHILSSPLKSSIWAQEREELLLIFKLKNQEIREKKLAAHAKKYEWLEYGLQGKVLDINYFKNEFKKLSVEKKQISFVDQVRNIMTKQKEVIKKYHIHPSHQKIFKIIQNSFYTRLYSKDAQFFGYYCMEPILREFGRRTALTLEQVRFLAHRDFKQALLLDKDFSRIASERQKYSLFICDKGNTQYFSGEQAKKIRKKLKFVSEKEDLSQTETLQGQPAYKGKVTGKVKIINSIPEMAKMHAGNILVSHMTNPGIVPAMKIAAGIVTDLGGITCHAAIIARELKRPCVIGTKIATKVFKDGDLVEVDANKGMVRKI